MVLFPRTNWFSLKCYKIAINDVIGYLIDNVIGNVTDNVSSNVTDAILLYNDWL